MKPSIPKGTRDFSPIEMVKRNYIFDTIRDVFKKFGFLPIETPSMENSATLMGKYGEEGDKLIFKILNSGDFLKEADQELLANKDSKRVTSSISEKALKYDLTVPFARYVVMHQNEITFPFKRYQIQPVWRADRPQKGRYREFYQCDADVIGSNSLLNEVELIMLIDEVFTKLGVKVKILFNNRKILSGIAEEIGAPDKFHDLVYSLDVNDKLGAFGVSQEMTKRDFSIEQIEKVDDYIRKVNNKAPESFRSFSELFKNSANGQRGFEELNSVMNNFGQYDFNGVLSQENKIKLFNKLEIDISLARGLEYYTGAIFEVKVEDDRSSFTSSICGGGRYDDLTGIFGLPNMSGVGISFGADRIYDVLEEANLFPKDAEATTKLLIVDYANDIPLALSILKQVHDANISAELYPDETKKFAKQMDYAEARRIPFVVILSKSNSNEVELKDIRSGKRETISLSELVDFIK